VNQAINLADLLFYGTAAITLATATYAVVTRNIVRAVFALLGTFFGVAVLYGMLSADFVMVIQVLVYVGGILVLMVFAVMLTSNIETASRSARSGSRILGFLVGIVMLVFLVTIALKVPWAQVAPDTFAPTTGSIGKFLLREALLPFEVVSIVLLGVVIGAVVIARMRFRGDGKEAGS
jgi:NADH-quinone oxidoreductase subunit J